MRLSVLPVEGLTVISSYELYYMLVKLFKLYKIKDVLSLLSGRWTEKDPLVVAFSIFPSSVWMELVFQEYIEPG